MKINISKLIFILCLVSPIIACSQTIEIDYHLGYDCSIDTNGEIARGGCSTFERLEYYLNSKTGYLKASLLTIKKEVKTYNNGKFSENLAKDSLVSHRIRKRIQVKELEELIRLILDIKASSSAKNDAMNRQVIVSSVAEFLTININYQGQKYCILQNYSGETNAHWAIETNNKRIYVISPEINSIISSLLPKKMRAKKKLRQFRQFDNLKEANE